MRAFNLAADQPWAITEAALDQILEIAARQNDMDIGAVAAKLGRPLDNTHNVDMRGDIAVVPITGSMFRYANLFSNISGGTSVQTLATDFNKALDDPNVRGIVLNVDSPGGEAKGVNELSRMIFDARARKPIFAYAGGEMASAAYWLGSAASLLIAEESALLGSLGVVGTFGAGVDSKSGKAKWEIVSSQSPFKRDHPSSDAGRMRIQAMIDSVAQVFLETVARNMNASIDKVLSDFGKGGVMNGRDAVAAGMAHRQGSLESAIHDVRAKAVGRISVAPGWAADSDGEIAAIAASKEQYMKAELRPEDKPTADPNIPGNRVPSPTNPNEDPKTKPGPTEGKDVPGVDPTPDRSPAPPAKTADTGIDVTALAARIEANVEAKLRGEFQAKLDSANALAANERDLRILGEYTKIAEQQYAGLPGKPAEKAAVLKAIEAMPEAQAVALKTMLASGNSAINTLMREKGTSGGTPESESAKASWDSAVEKIQSRDGISVYAATAKAMSEQKSLYAEYVREKGN